MGSFSSILSHRRAVLALALVWSLLACGAAAQDAGVKKRAVVLASAQLEAVMRELVGEYEARHEKEALELQIDTCEGARSRIAAGDAIDVLVLMSPQDMIAMAQRGLLAGKPRVIARDTLVVALAPENDGHVHELQDLGRQGAKVLLASPQMNLAGYTLKAIQKMFGDSRYGPRFRRGILRNLAGRGQSGRDIVTRLGRGEAHAGFVCASDISTPAREAGLVIEIPAEFDVPISYTIGVIRHGPRTKLAERFVTFILSAAGQEIVARNGYRRAR